MKFDLLLIMHCDKIFFVLKYRYVSANPKYIAISRFAAIVAVVFCVYLNVITF